MKAVDLLTGHSATCDTPPPYTGNCTCGLAGRQEAARAIDARVAALESALLALASDVELAADAARPTAVRGHLRSIAVNANEVARG